MSRRMNEACSQRSNRLSRGLKLVRRSDQTSWMLEQEKPSAVRASGSWLKVFQLYSLPHMHTPWQVVRVSDRMQAKPISVFIHLAYVAAPPHLPLSWGAQNCDRRPQGPKSRTYNDKWPLTACLRGITTLVCFPFLFTLSVCLLCSLLCCFFLLSPLPTALCDSGCWLKPSPLKLAVPVSPLFGSDPKAGDFHHVCKHLRVLMFWRMASRNNRKCTKTIRKKKNVFQQWTGVEFQSFPVPRKHPLCAAGNGLVITPAAAWVIIKGNKGEQSFSHYSIHFLLLLS